MKLTLSLLLVCVSVMVCEAAKWNRATREVQQQEESIYSAGQATGENPLAFSDAYQDFFAKLATAYAASNNGSVAAVSRLRTKEVNTNEAKTKAANTDGEKAKTN